jgi:hypothetical protein
MALNLTTASGAWKRAFITVLLSESKFDARPIDGACMDDASEASGIANLLRDCARDTRLTTPPPSPGAPRLPSWR